MVDKIQLRRGTAALWTSSNPILSEGEIGFETDTMLYKIGDGVTAWNALGYKTFSASIASAILMDAVSDPGAPAAGKMRLYAKEISGRMMPKFVGPSGLDTPVQPALFANGMMVVSPGLTTAFNYIGMGALTAVGTVSHPAITGTSLREQTRRGILTSAATANSASEARYAAFSCWRGDGAGMGGFFFASRFAISSTTALQQTAVGLFDVTTAIATTAVPSALLNCIFLGNDSADTNMQLMHNDGAGTCTKIDLGSSFPINTPTAIYELILYARTTDTSKVSYRVTNLTNGAVVTGDITTNLVATSTFLAFHAYANNGGTAAAVVLELMRMYLETDY